MDALGNFAREATRVRATAITIIILLSLPAAGALLAPLPLGGEILPAFPADIRDGDVLMLLAEHRGMRIERLPVPIPPGEFTLGTAVTLVATRANAEVAAADIAAFDALDPQLQAPLSTMLLAIDQAWALRNEAFQDVPLEDQRAARAAIMRGELDEVTVVGGPGDQELLLQAAILLSDTIESIVIPQLQAAAALGVWPATPVFDGVGILRVGGTGNDIETLDRILQVDARGDNSYFNNAGASTVAQDLDPETLDIASSVSLDLSGNDVYRKGDIAQGSGMLGIGLLYDLDGDDIYDDASHSTGYGGVGVGIFRDIKGEDYYDESGNSLGTGFQGVGYFRDDKGNDAFRLWGPGGGYSALDGIGLLWDRAGDDSHLTPTGGRDSWGYVINSGDGWFVDEGAGADTFSSETNPPHPFACNNCIWESGAVGTGYGNDNRGGLPFLLAKQRRIP